MNKLAKTFTKGTAFVGFVTGGDPNLEANEEIILAMAEAGADLIQLGIPFSDPIAEAPVVQAANLRALATGTTLAKIFALVEQLRRKTQIPMVFSTYLNPVFHYGYEAFFARCEAVGIDGIIIPDMPFEEQGELRGTAEAHGVAVINIITPTSGALRIKEITAQAKGYICVTGDLDGLGETITLVRAATDLPVVASFGMDCATQASQAAKIADGIVVDSAIVDCIERHGTGAAGHVCECISRLKAAF